MVCPARVIPAVAAATLLACSTIAPLPAQAQAPAYPVRAIRMVVPFAPGGTTDVLARVLGQQMGDRFGQTIVVDNRPGGSGVVGTTITARSAPDGYTLLLTSLSPVVINVSMFPPGKAPYDPEKDLAPISLITRVPSVIAALASSEIRSLGDLSRVAKARPGRVTFGTAGAGSVNHLIGELFRVGANIEILHVPYKGAGPAMAALLSKEVDLMISSPVAMMSQVRNGQVRALGVSGAKRSPVLPDTPAIGETAVPGFDSTAWYALMAAGGTPRPIVERVRGVLVQAMQEPAIAERLIGEGAVPETSTPEDLAQLIRVEIKRWAKAVQLSGAKLD
jgi:tripartite-type tricarboxylate transporter receptor subunit TctC